MQNYNDLQTDNPFLAKEWNYEKNGGLVPTDVKANSDKKVWWKCANEHEWQATIGSRNSGGHKCPYCSGELEYDDEVRTCPECGGCLHWDGDLWECSNCDYSEED